MSRIEWLVDAGARVVAFGPHLQVGSLREARTLGAIAVPNSQVERVLQDILSATP